MPSVWKMVSVFANLVLLDNSVISVYQAFSDSLLVAVKV